MNNRLIIRISQGSLSFSTVDQGQVVFERYPVKTSISMAANLREALRTIPLLQEEYSQVLVSVDSPVLLTPTDLYDENDQEAQYFYTFSRLEGHAVVSHVLPELNAVVLFSIHKDLRQVITDRFNNVRLQPMMVTVWNHMHEKSFTGPRQKLYGYFHDRRLEVFCFNQHRFRFYNAYSIGTNPNDAMFFLLSVWKQFGMDPREDELHLSGTLPEREQLTEEARRFVKRVFISNPSGEFNRAPVTQIEGMPYDLMLSYVVRN